MRFRMFLWLLSVLVVFALVGWNTGTWIFDAVSAHFTANGDMTASTVSIISLVAAVIGGFIAGALAKGIYTITMLCLFGTRLQFWLMGL